MKKKEKTKHSYLTTTEVDKILRKQIKEAKLYIERLKQILLSHLTRGSDE